MSVFYNIMTAAWGAIGIGAIVVDRPDSYWQLALIMMALSTIAFEIARSREER